MVATNYTTFYTVPSPITGTPGTIVKSEVSNLATVMVSIPAKATRVMYVSTDALGYANVVTGTYFEPNNIPWTGVGPRPLVVMAPATMGQGDQCAPSRLVNQVLFCGGNKNFMAEYQAGNIASKVKAGMAVFLTDYENMGTSFSTGKNSTFCNRKAQAHAVIDGAKAALNLSGTSLTSSSKICFQGYSQGGGAAGAAAELLTSYAPTLTNVVGACMGAPPNNFFN